MECFDVEFISPERRLDFTDVCSLCVRTPAGALTVMAHHERMLIDLLPGRVVLKNASGVLDTVMVSNAVMSIRDNICAVMADMVLLPQDNAGNKLKNVRDVVSSTTLNDGILSGLARVDLEFIDKVLKG